MLTQLSLLIALLSVNPDDKTPLFVAEFHMLKNKREEERFIQKYKNGNIDKQAYVISLRMKKAKYAFWIFDKLSVFCKEKKKLENLVKEYPQNPHLRYIRLVIQESCPKILGYRYRIESDKRFLKELLEKKDSTDYLDFYIRKNTSL